VTLRDSMFGPAVTSWLRGLKSSEKLPGQDTLRKLTKASKLALVPRWRAGLRQGVAASIEHDRLPLRRDFRTVIDVGANRGQFALYSTVRFPQAQIYSLEPLSKPRRQMAALFASEPRVHILAKAAGEAAGTASIHVSGQDDSSSLLPMAVAQLKRYPETAMVGTEDVEVDTLDGLFAGVDLEGPVLLKLDVQGYELQALKGGRELLGRVDAVLTEASFVPFYEGQALFDDLHGLLTDAGFQLAGGAMSAQAGGRWEQGDFVYERPVVATPQAMPRAAVAAA
jgi:FkbM family methyltransferase